MTQDAALTAGRPFRDAHGAVLHVQEQAALLVYRVNKGRTWKDGEFTAKCAEVSEVLLARLTSNLTAIGHGDLARKITAAAEAMNG